MEEGDTELNVDFELLADLFRSFVRRFPFRQHFVAFYCYIQMVAMYSNTDSMKSLPALPVFTSRSMSRRELVCGCEERAFLWLRRENRRRFFRQAVDGLQRSLLVCLVCAFSLPRLRRRSTTV